LFNAGLLSAEQIVVLRSALSEEPAML
jgi:hypothetical protein